MNVVRRGAGQHVAGNADAIGAAGVDESGIAVAVHRERDGVAHRDIGDSAGDLHRGRARAFGAIDGGDRVDRDGRRQGRAVDGIGLVRRRAGAVAGGVGHRHRRMHRIDRAGSEHIARHADAVGMVGCDRSGIGMAVHGQGDRIAHRYVAADRAGDGDRIGAGAFGRGDGRDRIDGDRDRRRTQFDVVRLVGRGVHDVAGTVGGRHRGMHVVDCGVGQHVAWDTDAIGVVGRDRAGIAVSIDRQRDGVARGHVGADRTGNGNRGRTGRFGAVDGSNGIDGDRNRFSRGFDRVGPVGRGIGRVAGHIGGRNGSMHIVDCGIGQDITRNADAIGMVGRHRRGVAVAVDRQRDRVAGGHVVADAAGDRQGGRAGAFGRGDRRNRVDRDADRRRRGFDGVGLIGRGRLHIARGIRYRHRGMHVVNRGAGQHIARNADAVGAAGLHHAGIAVAVDGQRHRVAHGHVGNRARNRNRGRTA